MIMSQRYPSYFDGIISGAPAMRTGHSNLALAFRRYLREGRSSRSFWEARRQTAAVRLRSSTRRRRTSWQVRCEGRLKRWNAVQSTNL